MKLKKLMALSMAGVMALSLAACGDTAAPAAEPAVESEAPAEEDGEAAAPVAEETDWSQYAGEKLVIWTLADDLIDFGEKFQETTGVEVETVVIEPANYPTKVQTALLAGETEPDIIVGEPQMLEDMYDAGFFADLDQFGAQDYADQIVDYVWKVGQSSDGVQRAISYQITPAGFYYRRDIAEEVFGTSDPDEIGKLNVSESRLAYMDLVVELYQQDLTAYAAQWATPWYQAMAGAVPLLTAETQWGTDDMNIWDAESFNAATEGMETTEVFAFGLPSWGVLTMRDHVGDTAGKWGVCAGPAYGFGGGTFIGVSSQSAKQELGWEFVKFCTLNEETAEWWIEFSEGDTISLIPVLEAHKDDTNEVYGGQQLYSFWLEQAEGIDYSKVTKYDTAIGNAWGEAISNIKTGAKSKEDAINEFYDQIEATFAGEIQVER